jgi:hypothetical protein
MTNDTFFQTKALDESLRGQDPNLLSFISNVGENDSSTSTQFIKSQAFSKPSPSLEASNLMAGLAQGDTSRVPESRISMVSSTQHKIVEAIIPSLEPDSIFCSVKNSSVNCPLQILYLQIKMKH